MPKEHPDDDRVKFIDYEIYRPRSHASEIQSLRCDVLQDKPIAVDRLRRFFDKKLKDIGGNGVGSHFDHKLHGLYCEINQGLEVIEASRLRELFPDVFSF